MFNHELEQGFPAKSLTEIISSEGIAPVVLPKGVWKGNDLTNASVSLFRVILEDGDPRWQIAQEYVRVKEEVGFKPLQFENALLAVYLSDFPGFRNGYSSYFSEENVRQLCRAIVNLRSFSWLQEQSSFLCEDTPPGVKLKLARTNRLTLGTNGQGVTGCPEAIYQLQLCCRDRYVARVGFNIHKEKRERVVSIANIQGTPVGEGLRHCIEDKCRVSPFNFLLRRLKSLTVDEGEVRLRGLKNPRHKEAAALYNSCLKKCEIPRFNFNRQ